MSAARKEYHHGQTPAAWAGVIISTLGFILAAISFFVGPDITIHWTMFWISIAVVLVGPIVGGVMVKMGYGQ